MRLLIALLLSMVSLHATGVGVNATKTPPVRKVYALKTAGAKSSATRTSSARKGKTGRKGGAKARAARRRASRRTNKTASARLK
jgi:hypothetical protein